MSGLCRAGLGYSDGLAVNCADDALPAGQRFFQTELDCCDEVVALAFEVGVFFLLIVSID